MRQNVKIRSKQNSQKKLVSATIPQPRAITLVNKNIWIMINRDSRGAIPLLTILVYVRKSKGFRRKHEESEIKKTK